MIDKQKLFFTLHYLYSTSLQEKSKQQKKGQDKTENLDSQSAATEATSVADSATAEADDKAEGEEGRI